MTKALNVGSSSSKPPSVGGKKAKRPRKASDSKSVKRLAEVSLSGKDKIIIDSIQGNVLLVCFVK